MNLVPEEKQNPQGGNSKGKESINRLRRRRRNVVEDERKIQVFEAATSVQDLAQAMNALGVSPRDISSIFQSLKSSGALHAKLEFQ